MTRGTTTRSSEEQWLEPQDENTALVLSGSILTWNLRTILPAFYTLAQAGLQLKSPETQNPGMMYNLTLRQDATGSRKLQWGSCFIWHNDEEPVLSTSAGARDVFLFHSDGTTMYGRHIFKQDPE